MFIFVALISIIELACGIYVLRKNLPKNNLKKAFISLFVLIIGLFIVFYPMSFLLIMFIIPISSIIINYTAYNKKYIKIVFLIMFILLLVSIVLQISDYMNYYKNNISNNIENLYINYLILNN